MFLVGIMFLLSFDSANSTAADRLQIYINGVRFYNFSSSTDPTSSEASVINSAMSSRILW
jgi:hypothetical protein